VTDGIVLVNLTYVGVERSARYLADIGPPLVLETVDIGLPHTHENIFRAFEAEFNTVQSSPEYVALTKRGERPRIVVIIDAISSVPGLLMPWERLVGFCRGHENVWSLVDAAHALGQIVGLDLSKTQPDFWVSVSPILAMWASEAKFSCFTQNCHKWLYSKRGCAILYVPRR